MSGSYNSDNKCRIRFSNATFSVESGKDNVPVVNVTWYGAKAFAKHYGFDLPTEAEWEYAARGGRQYEYGTDDGTINSSKANYKNNVGHPVNVGSYPANTFGLHDMTGNVWEWCNDGYGSYSSNSQTNPVGPSSDTGRVIRGGYWGNVANECRSTARFGWGIGNDYYFIGFRVVRRSGGVTY